MTYQNIPLSQLRLNVANDRHGPMDSEQEAITWHFKNLGDRAVKLATDIVQSNEIYEQPLVMKEGNGYVVKDGNRRLTCLKAILKPELIKDSAYRRSFENLSKQLDRKKFEKILCRVETDSKRVDEIVHRRHTGGTSGVGQVKWDAFAKENYLDRIGKAQSKSIGVTVANFAEQNHLIDDAKQIKSSTLHRLLSSKDVRERIGLAVNGSDVTITGDDRATKQTLKQILQDIVSGEITLPDLWSKAHKHEYLDRLAKEGFSIAPLEGSKKGKKQSSTATKKNPKKAAFDVRGTLIPKALNFDFASSKPGLLKIWRVWDELQNRLYLNRNPCSIGVMFRCLIWMATDHYVNKHGVKNARQDLHLRMKDVADHMEQAQLIDSGCVKVIKAFADSEKLISARTTHMYVHSLHLVPDEGSLRAMWETLDVYICACLGIK